MKIVLLRHAKPDIPEFGKLRASEIRRWIESYNSAGIMKDHQPLREAVEIANNCNAIVCSDLSRSVESAEALRIKGVNYSTDNPKQKIFIDQRYYDIKFNLKIDENARFNTSDESITGFEKEEIKPE